MTYFWKARTLPGGFLGLMMLATGIFSNLQHYMVNSFIVPVGNLPTWCNFTSGIVTTTNSAILEPSWPGALLIFNAHTAMLANGGDRGIYDKVNNNISSFQPTPQDILGTWICTSQHDFAIVSEDMANTTAVVSYLTNQNYLDNSTLNLGGSVNANTGAFNGFLAWSGDFEDEHSSAWTVSATIANTFADDAPTIASNFKCTLIQLLYPWTPAPMPSNATLAAWKNIMFGFISQVPVAHYEAQLETVLNAMSMLAGSGNQNGLSLPAGTPPKYGCVSSGARVDMAVHFVFAFLFLILLVLLVADLYQLAQYCRNREKKIAEDVPTDLISWQLNLVRRLTGKPNLTTRDLKKWSYVLNEKKEFVFKETKVLQAEAKAAKQAKNKAPEDIEQIAGGRRKDLYRSPGNNSTHDIPLDSMQSSETLLHGFRQEHHDLSESKQSRR